VADEPSAEQGPGQSPGRAAEARRYPARERLGAAENEARFVELIRGREFVGTDSTLSREAEVNDFLAQFRAHGYRSEIAFVATPLAVSWMGNLDRYQGQYETKGIGRTSLRAPYESTAAQILDTVTNLEQQGAVDEISVYRRGDTLLYRNTRTPDSTGWTDPPRVRDAVATERSREWTQPEAQALIAQMTDLAARTEPQWRPDLVYAIDLAGNRAPTRTHQETLHALREQLDRGDLLVSSVEPETDTPRIYSGGSAVGRSGVRRVHPTRRRAGDGPGRPGARRPRIWPGPRTRPRGRTRPRPMTLSPRAMTWSVTAATSRNPIVGPFDQLDDTLECNATDACRAPLDRPGRNSGRRSRRDT
jgi:hypothetical protein